MNSAILVDGANLAFVLKELGTEGHPLKIDLVKLESELSKILLNGESYGTKIYYLNYRTDADLVHLRPFTVFIENHGWRWIVSRCKAYLDGHYKDKRTDVTMVLDAMELVKEQGIDSISILTHDADFAPLFERLPKSAMAYAIGFRDKMATELSDAALPVFLDAIWPRISMEEP